MTPRKHGSGATSEPTPAKNALKRLAAWIARLRAPRTMPPLRMPKHPKVQPPHASWLSAFWSARIAARHRIPIDVFLQHRLARYLAHIPAPPSRFPVSVSIDPAGTIVTAPTPVPKRAPWVEAFLRATGPATLRSEILMAQGEAAGLAARIESQRQRVEELSRDLDETTRGVQLADPSDEVQATQLGRPVVPPPIGLGLQLFALALLLAESWQLAVPCLEVAGIQTTQLLAELQRDAVGVVMGCIFAVGASATLFLLAHLALRRVLDAGDPKTPPRGIWTGVTSGFAVTLIVALAWSVASLRPDAAHAVDVGNARLTLFLVLLAMPFTGAWLLGVARHTEQARAHVQALARAWDAEHYRTLADFARRAAVVGEEEQRLSALEAERAAVTRRLLALERRCATAERLAADAIAQDQEDLATAVQAVVGALETDRYEYVRQAAVRGLRIPRPEAPAIIMLPAVVPATAPVRAAGDAEHNLGLAG